MMAIAGEIRSDARVASEGPALRGEKKNGSCKERSRGTGPRATVVEAASLHRRARACPSPSFALSKTVFKVL